ncbi:STAS domain-containing protein [Sulfitobacter sabulilitoris]|uniref:STAS domain-containing protein n=1 Tax=Sulfitobacter sabulilitoris TaxID=2562655 RepID=A0A5S3PJV7_9RHOB|nr:STAS domain-containing protein [Sulfitobacter sabulilitoris]TMM54663.1 STAS domain-containing protein [Sulfitobacter sabulilitoris]
MIVLDPKLDLPAATPLRRALCDAAAGDLTLDAGRVTHFGALCLQVLCAAAADRRSQGARLSVVNTSDRVLDQLRVMGMTPESISEGCK